MTPTLTVNIRTPHPNEEVAENLLSKVAPTFRGDGTFKHLTCVTIQFGENEPARIAQLRRASLLQNLYPIGD